MEEKSGYLVQLEDLHNSGVGENGSKGEYRLRDENVVIVPHLVSAHAHAHARECANHVAGSKSQKESYYSNSVRKGGDIFPSQTVTGFRISLMFHLSKGMPSFLCLS